MDRKLFYKRLWKTKNKNMLRAQTYDQCNARGYVFACILAMSHPIPDVQLEIHFAGFERSLQRPHVVM